jgi:DNA-directed RNA polymerase subunit RPC12/RpoP
MTKCARCGGKVRRVHRTLAERLRFLAVYECLSCQEAEFVPRQFQYHLGPETRCPSCGTLRITKLKERDKIDPMNTGLLNFLERIFGGNLYHCCFCRLQFYDRRIPGQRLNHEVIARALRASSANETTLTIQPDTARLDA